MYTNKLLELMQSPDDWSEDNHETHDELIVESLPWKSVLIYRDDLQDKLRNAIMRVRSLFMSNRIKGKQWQMYDPRNYGKYIWVRLDQMEIKLETSNH